MNNKFKKSALILALALGITACGNDNAKPADDAAEEPANTAETTENTEAEDTAEKANESNEDTAANDTGDTPTLVYYNIGAEPARHTEVVTAINEYLDSQNAGYHIDTVYYDWGDYQQKLQLAVNSGEDWDLAFTANWAGPYKTLADQNALLDLSDYLDNELKDAVALIDERMIEGSKINGPLYGLPAAYPGVVAANQFVWNKEYVDKYEIPYKDVKNTTDLEQYLKQVKDNEPNAEYPYAVASDYLFARSNPVFEVTSGVGVKEEDGKLTAYNIYESEDFKNEINQMKKLYDEGLINPDAPQLQPGEGNGAYESSLVGQAEGEPGSQAVWSKPGEEKYSSIIGESIVIDNNKATGKLVSVNSQSEYKDQAIDFINRMYTDQKLQDLLSYGVEGEDYELVDGKVQRLNVENPDKEVYDVAGFQYLSMFKRTPMAGGTGIGDPEFDEEVKEFESKLVASPTLGFNIDRTPIEGELENIDSTVGEYFNNLKTGAFDDSYYNEFLDKLKTAGIEKAVTEVQKQLDAWNK